MTAKYIGQGLELTLPSSHTCGHCNNTIELLDSEYKEDDDLYYKTGFLHYICPFCLSEAQIEVLAVWRVGDD